MSKFLYYNTLYGCETDGKNVFYNGKQLKPFVPKDRAVIQYKINGKVVTLKQIHSQRYLVPVFAKKDLPDWCY